MGAAYRGANGGDLCVRSVSPFPTLAHARSGVGAAGDGTDGCAQLAIILLAQ